MIKIDLSVDASFHHSTWNEGVLGRQISAVMREKKIPPNAMFNQLDAMYSRLALKYAHVKLGMIPINNAIMAHA